MCNFVTMLYNGKLTEHYKTAIMEKNKNHYILKKKEAHQNPVLDILIFGGISTFILSWPNNFQLCLSKTNLSYPLLLLLIITINVISFSYEVSP